ncbi:hypothetical protein [Streptomyces sannanensis]|uniref:hypothetical protein n=1 Tax=Streptomyces sannanensis TaxID=285536 RepID=UPI0031EE7D76
MASRASERIWYASSTMAHRGHPTPPRLPHPPGERAGRHHERPLERVRTASRVAVQVWQLDPALPPGTRAARDLLTVQTFSRRISWRP